ncbi:sel1 repeat family protein [Paracoccus amoyensis]|uniref:sel1 repeat family protein n=1 Tax=Paracoccus amoyensis TaxID=2760093 RepID=UPI001659E3E8|nr:sel1 repeat family protein [Paracoccus amoyensis]
MHLFLTSLAILFPSVAFARCADATTPALTCQIAGKQQRVNLCLTQDSAIYSYGMADAPPELTLTAKLTDLDYRRRDGAGSTIDEVVTFRSGDHAFQIDMGFDGGDDPYLSSLAEYTRLTVTRGDTQLAALECAPPTIERAYDRIAGAMRDVGRDKDSNVQTLPEEGWQPLPPVSNIPECERVPNSNADTCWDWGSIAERHGQTADAIAFYDKACDEGFISPNCYYVGKFRLLNPQFRDYGKAADRFRLVCEDDDIGTGPYGCKYIGWMHHTGTGQMKDPQLAWYYLNRACFTHNDGQFIDAEGCHFLANMPSSHQMAQRWAIKLRNMSPLCRWRWAAPTAPKPFAAI